MNAPIYYEALDTNGFSRNTHGSISHHIHVVIFFGTSGIRNHRTRASQLTLIQNPSLSWNLCFVHQINHTLFMCIYHGHVVHIKFSPGQLRATFSLGTFCKRWSILGKQQSPGSLVRPLLRWMLTPRGAVKHPNMRVHTHRRRLGDGLGDGQDGLGACLAMRECRFLPYRPYVDTRLSVGIEDKERRYGQHFAWLLWRVNEADDFFSTSLSDKLQQINYTPKNKSRTALWLKIFNKKHHCSEIPLSIIQSRNAFEPVPHAPATIFWWNSD